MPELLITHFSQKPYNPPVSPDIPDQPESQARKYRDLLKRLGRKLKQSIEKSVAKTVQLIRTPIPLLSSRRRSKGLAKLSDPDPLMDRKCEGSRKESHLKPSEMNASQSIALKDLEMSEVGQLAIPRLAFDVPVFGLSFERRVS